MLHLVSEQFDSHWDGMEYGLLGPERISQLEREDLDRYHRSFLKSSSYCDSMDGGIRSKADEDSNMDQETINEVLLQFRDETKSEMAEMKAQMSLIISLLQDPCKKQEANISDPDEAANEVEEMVTRSPSEIHEDDICCDSVGSIEMVSRSDILKENIVEAYAHKLFDGMPSLLSIEVDENHCAFLGKMSDHNKARKVFTEMPEPILEENLVSTEVSTYAHYQLNERPVLSPVDLDEDCYGKKDSLSLYPYIIEIGCSINESIWISGLLNNISKVSTGDVSYMDDMLGVSVTSSSSLTKLGFNPQVFDPGTLSLFKQNEYERQVNTNESRRHFISSELFLIYPHVSVLFQVASSPHNNANLQHDFDYYSESETTTVSLDEVLVENAVPSLEEFSDFNDYVSHESTIKDPLIDDVSKLNEIMVSEWFMRCAITVQSSIIDVNKQNRENGDDRFKLYLFVYAPPMLVSVNPIIGLHKAWGTGVTSRMVVNLGPIVIRNDALHLYYETTPAYRAYVIDGQLMEPYTRGINSNNLTLINPGGGGKCLLSVVRGIVFPLGTEAPEICVDSLNGVDGLLMFIFDPGISSWHLSLFGKYYGAGVHGRKGVVFSLRQAQSDVAYGDWYYLIVFNSHDLFLLISDSIEHGASFSKSLFEEANSKSLRKFLCCCTWPLGRLTNELDLVTSFGSWISFLSPLKASFAWDPGICVIFAYILEDKDVFKRVGKWIVIMEHITELSITVPILMNQGKDHLGAIVLQLAGDMAMLNTGVEYHLHGLDITYSFIVNKRFTQQQMHVCNVGLDALMTQLGQMFGAFKLLHNIYTFSGSVETVMCNGVELTFQTTQGWSTWWEAIFLDITTILHLDEAIWISMKYGRNMLQVFIEDILSPGSSFKLAKAYKVTLTKTGVMLLFWLYMVRCSLKINGDKLDLGFYSGDKVPNACLTSASASSNMYGFVSTFNLLKCWKALVFAETAMSKTFEMALLPMSCTSYSLRQRHSKEGKCSDVAYTNVVQYAAMLKIFIWDRGVGHFTTLRTRRLLRGRKCHKSSIKLFKYYYIVLRVRAVSACDVIQRLFYISTLYFFRLIMQVV